MITIEEGSLYRYGSLKVEGGENLEIQRLFGQLPGDLMNFEELKRSFESVKHLLAEQGFLDREVIPEIKPDEATHTVAVTVHISPGRPYLVARVNFTNSGSEAQDKQLREAWILEPGHVFRPSLLAASIARVNDLHLFQQLTESDCEVIRRPEPNSVDVLVRLRPLAQ